MPLMGGVLVLTLSGVAQFTYPASAVNDCGQDSGMSLSLHSSGQGALTHVYLLIRPCRTLCNLGSKGFHGSSLPGKRWTKGSG
ncbi:hypothetical protein BDQ17DRAFT_1376507 [Cyathus striatus]|nr:hypothetical protein BDQ17DRAFT_1376507 [Cyathus striatus]